MGREGERQDGASLVQPTPNRETIKLCTREKIFHSDVGLWHSDYLLGG